MRNNFKLERHKGFSLLEMLIYVAILALLLMVVMGVIVSISKSNRLIRSARSIDTSASLSMERMTREARLSDSIAPGSTLNVHPGDLILNSTDASNNPRTVEFYISNGRLMMKENSVDLGALTESATRVTSLIFRRFSGAHSEGVRIEMTLESGADTGYKTETFYSTAVLR
ncbi:prepilin-type N-terminal cleavage/methylation domain-containing protein [Candidatus Parcubacteria bacterium]|nr:prepilin-type N-terminal cleavage/methylation domain-containing protein [Candidatus Parcubacteria bacterium]